MQPPAPPPQLYAPPPPRPGWGRFWLGVLAGGCALLLLEAVGPLVGVAVIGTAITGVVRQGNGGGTLPGGVALPQGLPNLSQRSDPCSPQPCMAHGGLTVQVGEVNRSAGPASDGRSHLVAVSVTFVGT